MMKFEITRTTYSFDAEAPPHPKAFLEEVIVEEKLIFYQQLPQSIKDEQQEWFKEGGFNHRSLENGVFARDNRAKRWFIEINSLDELIAIAKEEDPERGIIFNGETIEIYDSYRE